MQKARIDVTMRLMLDSDSYAKVGEIMDATDAAVRRALRDAGVERAAFDFVGVQTYPCKAADITRYADVRYADAPTQEPFPGNGGMPELPAVESAS